MISTTATLAAVFVPISFLPGAAGGLFREFGYVLAVAVLISAFIALTLCPMLAAHFLKSREDEKAPGLFKRAIAKLGSGLAMLYATCLRACLAFPLVVVVAAGIFSFAAYLTFLTLPQELTPSEDRGVVLMSITAPQSASLDYTSGQLRRVEQIVLPYVRSGEATNVYAIAGRGAAIPAS